MCILEGKHGKHVLNHLLAIQKCPTFSIFILHANSSKKLTICTMFNLMKPVYAFIICCQSQNKTKKPQSVAFWSNCFNCHLPLSSPLHHHHFLWTSPSLPFSELLSQLVPFPLFLPSLSSTLLPLLHHFHYFCCPL